MKYRYLQNLLLNLALIKTDGSKVDWALYSGYSIITTGVWIIVIYTVLLLLFWGPIEKKERPIFSTVVISIFAWLSSQNDIDDRKSYQALLRGQLPFLNHVFLLRDRTR